MIEINRSEDGMTVQQLIDELRTHDPEDVVWAEGCDCINPVKGADHDTGRVLLTVDLW